MSGRPHYWDGVMTTQPLREFFREHLHESNAVGANPRFGSFSMVVANPTETGLKFGIKVIHLRDPAHLGRIDVTYDQLSGSCSFRLSNILMWIMPQTFVQCRVVNIDGQAVDAAAEQMTTCTWLCDGKRWQLLDGGQEMSTVAPMREQRQLGHLDAILRTYGPFTIVTHTPETARIALQVSRNLYQYVAADTIIEDQYERAVHASGNIICLATGLSVPGERLHGHAIEINDGKVTVHPDSPYAQFYEKIDGHGLGAIFIRPLPNDRLQLVIWGKDERSLDTATRLVPMMPGSGQPDFVVVDDRMLLKGLDGARAMGFFDAWWNVTRSSFLS